MDLNNVVCPPARRSDGKKIDTWKVKLPGPDHIYADVDIFMTCEEERQKQRLKEEERQKREKDIKDAIEKALSEESDHSDEEFIPEDEIS